MIFLCLKHLIISIYFAHFIFKPNFIINGAKKAKRFFSSRALSWNSTPMGLDNASCYTLIWVYEGRQIRIGLGFLCLSKALGITFSHTEWSDMAKMLKRIDPGDYSSSILLNKLDFHSMNLPRSFKKKFHLCSFWFTRRSRYWSRDQTFRKHILRHSRLHTTIWYRSN